MVFIAQSLAIDFFMWYVNGTCSSCGNIPTIDSATADALLLNTWTGYVSLDSGVLFGHWADHCAEHGFDIRVAHLSGYERHDCAGDPAISDRDANRDSRQAELNRVFHQAGIIEADDDIIRPASKGTEPYDEPVKGTRFDTVEAPAEMDSDWSDIAIDGLYLAADLAMIGETDDEDSQKSKNVRERRNGQKKKDRQSGGMQMKM